MNSLAEVLEFMFPGLEGILTDGNAITSWPPGGPSQPAQVQIDQGFIDFAAAKPGIVAGREADMKILKAIVLWLVDELNALGRAPVLTGAAARSLIITKFKSLS